MGLTARGINSVILDIEGTTTPIEFVHSFLFDYVKRNVTSFLRNNFDKPEVAACIGKIIDIPDLPPEFRPQNRNVASENTLENVSYAIKYLVEKDSKATPLKEIEGLMWEEGYRNGSIRGEVYDDVLEAIKRWRNAKMRIYIYSSGSALSQRLLFSTTVHGDLTIYIDGFFDTAVGKKTDPESYGRISERIGEDKKNLIFISDADREILAARESGMHALLINRNPDPDSGIKTGEFIKDLRDRLVIP